METPLVNSEVQPADPFSREVVESYRKNPTGEMLPVGNGVPKYTLYNDFETGGLDCYQHEPVELAAVLLDENLVEVGRFSSGLIRVRHPELLHPRALACNGYTVAEIMAGRDPVEAFKAFADWLESACPELPVRYGGHNAPFDMGFMREAFRKYQPPGRMEGLFGTTEEMAEWKVDTKLLADRKLKRAGKLAKTGLVAVTEYFGIEHKAHKALGDVLAGAEVLRRLQ